MGLWMENSDSIVFFSDLDDTLIQTKRKTNFEKNVILAAVNKKGEDSSFFYQETKYFLDNLVSKGILFIPTTARNISAYRRTIIEQEYSPEYAILNFGGTILRNGEVCPLWKEEMRKSYLGTTPLIYIETALVWRLDMFDISPDIISISKVDDFYISITPRIKDDKKLLLSLSKLFSVILELYPEYHLYESDNSFALLPNCLNKKFAVEYLIKELNPSFTLGAGDNLHDLSFMDCCSFKVIPSESIIDNKLLKLDKEN